MGILLVIICTVLLIVLLRLHFLLKKDDEYLRQTIDPKKFLEHMGNYSGFLVVTNSQFLLNEIDLYRKIIRKLIKISRCHIVSLTRDGEYHLDFQSTEFLSNLQIQRYPLIVFLVNGSIYKRVLSFENLSDRQIIKEITRYSRQVEI
ncbi:hypothetical protein [Paenibacillus sp. SI8]|uniref:hypothetical protein n=1 Tax=unclassified Paenibacillus TaxID=185978 RepID=UPI0034651C4D